MADLQLTSPAFEDGAAIPERYGYTEDNVNPPLEIAGAPASTESFLIVVDDPDAREPAGKIWDHWVVWNIDGDTDSIPEDWDPEDAGAVTGENDYGETGWGGPNPPDREHTYRFLLYALDDRLDLSAAATKDDAYDAAEGCVVGKAQLEGTYAP
ncbi:YbhB/YbcL family Raf kinase inhibitor-like protein [Halosimplex halobium]|uniref:YbhB/YbcL family Raf kinase inhibitor-like protein n=1 Tax=Halosimplex halobium TaxID=3396618 RepID=UPI003F564882